jgi:hypothetical protein
VGGIIMNALRKIVKAENHTITVELPIDFSQEEDFEVIIFPARSEIQKSVHRKSGNDPDKMIAEETKIFPPKRVAGLWKGQIFMTEDFDAPLEDFKEYME